VVGVRSHVSPCSEATTAVKDRHRLTPEFVKLKQTWQQTKETAFRAKEGEEIVPGFKGKYHD